MRVLITGGSGFLGRGIQTFWSKNEYIVYSRDEYKQDMARQVLGLNDRPSYTQWILGDVCDLDRLTYAMKGVDLVIHTAAIKYIPEAEFNVDECVKVNVDGSRNVIKAAIRAGVQRVVGISTDKAVQPVNTYGMTKALMERLFAEANNYSSTIFTCTRYGNVVGSTGSVFTVFQRQLEQQGTLTITEPTMTRYWQSIRQSVELIKLAADASPGDIIIPRGASMQIGKLANYLLTSRGLQPDSRIQVVGIRPGEKKHESLAGAYEMPRISIQIKSQLNESKSYYALRPIGQCPKSPIDNDLDFTSEYPDAQVTFHDMNQMMAEAQTVSYK